MSFYRFLHTSTNQRGDDITVELIPGGPTGPLVDIVLPKGSVTIGAIGGKFESEVCVGWPESPSVDVTLRHDVILESQERGYSQYADDLLTYLATPQSGTVALDIGNGETMLAPLVNVVRITATGPSFGGGTRTLFEGVQNDLSDVPVRGNSASGARSITVTFTEMFRALGTLVPVEALTRRCLNVLTPETTEHSSLQGVWLASGSTIGVMVRRGTIPRVDSHYYRFADVIGQIATLYQEHYRNLWRDGTKLLRFESTKTTATPLDYIEGKRWSGAADGSTAATLQPGSVDPAVSLYVVGSTSDVAFVNGAAETVDGTGGILEDTGAAGSLYEAESIWDIMQRLTSSGMAKGTIYYSNGPSYAGSTDLTVYFGKLLNRTAPIGRTQTWTIDEQDLGPWEYELKTSASRILDVEAGYPEGKNQPVNAEREAATRRSESDQGANLDFVLHSLPNTEERSEDPPFALRKESSEYVAHNPFLAQVLQAPYDAQVFYMAWEWDGHSPASTVKGTGADPIPVLMHPAVGFDLGAYTWNPADPDIPMERPDGSGVRDEIDVILALRRGAARHSWGRNLARATADAFGRASQWSIADRWVPYELANLETLGGYFEFLRDGVSIGAQLWLTSHPAYASLPLTAFLTGVSIDTEAGRAKVTFLGVDRSAP